MVEIKGFLETSFLDWPGKICSVLFLPGCNFRCPYCHNHPLVFRPGQFASLSLKDIFKRLLDLKGWIDGVCLTGGEPTQHADLPLLIHEIKENGYPVKLDTNGSHPEMLETLIDQGEIASVAMDVKAPLNPLSYRRSAGLSVDIASISKSIEILKRGRVDYQFRMTVVPQLHSEEEIRALGGQLRVGRRLTLQNFNPENPLDPSFQHMIPYDPNVLREMESRVQEMV